jgi:hypothetical protein
MEMGFPRRHIEYAMQTTQSNNLERLVGWLLDHANLEVPELASPPDAPASAAPTPTPPTTGGSSPAVNRQPGREAAATSRTVVVVTGGSDSSSDSSDYSDEEGEDDDDGDGKKEGGERDKNNLSIMSILRNSACIVQFFRIQDIQESR